MTKRFAAMIVVALSSTPAIADGVSIPMEVEGTLAENGNRYWMMVSGDAPWALELDGFRRAAAKETLKSTPNARVRAFGVVAVRLNGNQILIPTRVLQVSTLAVGKPGGMKITRIEAGSPAANRLAVDDIIIEIEGKTITNRERLHEVLGPLRGKTVSIVVIRDGISKVIDGIALLTTEPALGVHSEPVLTWSDGVSSPSTGGPPDPPKPPKDG